MLMLGMLAIGPLYREPGGGYAQVQNVEGNDYVAPRAHFGADARFRSSSTFE
jgi:hypothetical protein